MANGKHLVLHITDYYTAIVNDQTDKFGYREMMRCVPAEHPHQTVY
jgi:hypothetical protein